MFGMGMNARAVADGRRYNLVAESPVYVITGEEQLVDRRSRFSRIPSYRAEKEFGEP
jgi:hypothetical protein